MHKDTQKSPYDHSHEHSHGHAHSHGHHHSQKQNETILTVRALSGLSGDIILCGLARMLQCSDIELREILKNLKIPALENCVSIITKNVNEIAGYHAQVTLEHEHAHRTLTDILTIIEKTSLTINAKKLSIEAFTLLAEAEASVHNKCPESVTFHEVGALDSILDICISCALFDKLAPDHFICSPLPLADGSVYCAHGHIPTPAPAVLKMLKNIPVCAFKGQGETITPTAIALLKTFNTHFGLWPAITIQESAIVYGTKTFSNVANGTIWAFGKAHKEFV